MFFSRNNRMQSSNCSSIHWELFLFYEHHTLLWNRLVDLDAETFLIIDQQLCEVTHQFYFGIRHLYIVIIALTTINTLFNNCRYVFFFLLTNLDMCRKNIVIINVKEWSVWHSIRRRLRFLTKFFLLSHAHTRFPLSLNDRKHPHTRIRMQRIKPSNLVMIGDRLEKIYFSTVFFRKYKTKRKKISS